MCRPSTKINLRFFVCLFKVKGISGHACFISGHEKQHAMDTALHSDPDPVDMDCGPD